MRIAALAFGIVAGLVASLILALGGLDAAALAADARQVSLIRFALFVVAGSGVLGAGVVLAAPLAGAILLVLAAIAWIVASVLLGHGPDYVMLTPPALLLAAAALAGLARFRARRDADDDYAALPGPGPAAARAGSLGGVIDNPAEDAEDGGAVSVGASFFGEAGTATTMSGAFGRSPEPSGPDPRDNWEPIRRRTEPPRTKPMFRPPEEEYEEEGGFSRAARLTSSVLSFGLYAGLAAAAVLVFANLRESGVRRPTVTTIEASTPAPSAAPVLSAPAPSLDVAEATPPSELSTDVSSAIAPILAEPSSRPPAAEAAAPGLDPLPPGLVVADAATPLEAPSTNLATDLAPPTPTAPSEPSSSASEPPPEDLTLGRTSPGGPLLPYPVPPEIAAERNRPAPQRPAEPPPAQPRPDAGL